MKVVCPVCETGYNVSVDKLLSVVAKAVCKKCGATLLINKNTGKVEVKEPSRKSKAASPVSSAPPRIPAHSVISMPSTDQGSRDYLAIGVVVVAVIALIITVFLIITHVSEELNYNSDHSASKGLKDLARHRKTNLGSTKKGIPPQAKKVPEARESQQKELKKLGAEQKRLEAENSKLAIGKRLTKPKVQETGGDGRIIFKPEKGSLNFNYAKPVLDQTHKKSDGYFSLRKDSPYVQTFTPSISGRLSSVELKIQVLNGGEAFSVIVGIAETDTGIPTDKLLGETKIKTLAPGWQSYSVNLFKENIILIAGTEYAIVIKSEAPRETMHTIAVRWQNSPYADGALWQKTSKSNWELAHNGVGDAVFSTYMIPE